MAISTLKILCADGKKDAASYAVHACHSQLSGLKDQARISHQLIVVMSRDSLA